MIFLNVSLIREKLILMCLLFKDLEDDPLIM